MTKILTKPYALDLGNGWTKRTFDGVNVITEPSAVAEVPEGFQFETCLSIRYSEGRLVYIGNDAVKSGQSLYPALGDLERYAQPEYKELLFGFMGKDLQDDTIIPLLVLGLPNSHYKKMKDSLEKEFVGKKKVTIDGKDIILTIQKVEILPQPLGTYMYLVKEGKIQPTGRYLFVDGGSGSLDISEIDGNMVVKFYGNELGMFKAYTAIIQHLRNEFGDVKITNHTLPNILSEGLEWDGGVVNVATDPTVIRLFDNHYREAKLYVLSCYTNLKQFKNVVYSGGMYKAYEERLKKEDMNNAIVLKNAQDTNVLGFFNYGEAHMKQIKEIAASAE